MAAWLYDQLNYVTAFSARGLHIPGEFVCLAMYR